LLFSTGKKRNCTQKLLIFQGNSYSYTEPNERLLLEYLQTCVYCNPYACSRTRTHINVNSALLSDSYSQYIHTHTCILLSYSFVHFWHAPLGVHSTKRRHQSPEWTILSQVSCFIHGEVIGFQALLDSLHPRSTRVSW